MISWIAAWHDQRILDDNLGATLKLIDNDELILIEGAESITLAYAEGQAKATQPVKCYIHSDVQILDLVRLRMLLIHNTAGDRGIVGVIGSRTHALPWWNGTLIGSVIDSRLGTLDYGFGGPCTILDGMLLATRRYVSWDISWPGWHGYDHDACAQMRALGQENFCLSEGATMIRHNADLPVGPVAGWPEAEARYREKWL